MASPADASEQRAAARARLCALRLGQPAPVPALLRHVRRVVVLASSSRGGSSVLAEILRNCGHLLHFRAETNPFLVLSGQGWPESRRDGDALDAGDIGDLPLLEHLLAHDLGRPTGALPSRAAKEAFGRELHWRLSLQWPLQRFDRDWIQERLEGTLRRLEREHGWAPGTFPDPPRFHALFLAAIRERHERVSPWYYDLPPRLIREHCPDIEPSDAPPSPVVLEEPPFVTVSPWRSPTVAELERLPLVIKTPSNAYRLPFLRAVFPNARLDVLHLTRNAAASMNGLVDGWRFRGFFAHALPGPLDMPGYTDRFPAWAQRWWKFDLPPGFEAWTHRPLVEVCGFQWRSSHRSVLRWLADNPEVSSHRVPFEHVVGTHDQRLAAFDGLTRWLGIPSDPTLQRLVETGLPPIMATKRPRHRRWFDKAELLEPALEREDTRAIMGELGYSPDPTTWI